MKNEEFKRFDEVSDPSDHYFVNEYPNEKNQFSDSKSRVFRHMMKEWKILEPNLPESICVRTYESRIDLMRAVIIGAAGTPYHDGLFFFDIAFPLSYPENPPRIHFHSFGYRINPNLYRNGMVCLSLLNTWTGRRKEEMWDPSKSNLFQVLLSIQALVLNEKPFFNEPGSNILGRFNDSRSREYNDHVFTLTCNISLALVRNPPKNFEAFVRNHFRLRGFIILMACKEYVNGHVRVGYYNCCYNNNNLHQKKNKYNLISSTSAASSSTTTVTPKKVSVVSPLFFKSLQVVYGKMYSAFVECGAPIEPSFKNLELENKEEEPKPSKTKSKSVRGIFKKAITKIKRTLGWKKQGEISAL